MGQMSPNNYLATACCLQLLTAAHSSLLFRLESDEAGSDSIVSLEENLYSLQNRPTSPQFHSTHSTHSTTNMVQVSVGGVDELVLAALEIESNADKPPSQLTMRAIAANTRTTDAQRILSGVYEASATPPRAGGAVDSASQQGAEKHIYSGVLDELEQDL